MGNGIKYKFVGIGTMQIKTHDGVVRTLSKVRHISDITRNLISLGTLEANGCRYSAENGVLEVTKGVMVLMKGLRQGSFYLMHGTTVTDSAAICTTSTDVNTTKLRHMRLGYMSEKRMTILSKKGCLGSAGMSKLDFCEHCVIGKQKRVSFFTTKHHTQGILNYIHSDLWGSFESSFIWR